MVRPVVLLPAVIIVCACNWFSGKSTLVNSASSSVQQGLQVDQVAEAPGVEVLIGAGTVASDTAVSVHLGTDIANAVTSTKLGAPALSSVGAAVTVSASEVVELSGAGGTLILPLNSANSANSAELALQTSLTDDDPFTRLVIVYKVKRADGSMRLGLIPRAKLILSGGKVLVPFLYFGTYQAALVPEGQEADVARPAEIVSATDRWWAE